VSAALPAGKYRIEVHRIITLPATVDLASSVYVLGTMPMALGMVMITARPIESD